MYRPPDAAAAMEALGIPDALVDKFVAATERVTAVSLEAVEELMASAGLSLRQRRAVKQRLQRDHTIPSSDAVSACI